MNTKRRSTRRSPPGSLASIDCWAPATAVARWERAGSPGGCQGIVFRHGQGTLTIEHDGQPVNGGVAKPAGRRLPERTASSAGSRSIVTAQVVVVATCAAVFLYLALAVAGGEGGVWDRALLESVADWRTAWLNRALWFFTLLGNTAVLAVLTVAAGGLLLMWGRRSAALVVMGAVVSGSGISRLFKILISRSRPPETLAIIEPPASFSLPSGHALTTAVFVGALFLVLLHVLRLRTAPGKGEPATTKLAQLAGGATAVVLTALIGLSRVWLGVHWPSDVLAGWCLAGIWLVFVAWFFQRWRHSKQALPDARPWGRAAARVVVVAVVALITGAVLVLEGLAHPLST